MYKRNELYQKIADGKITPEQVVDIILSLQEENVQLRNGIDNKDNPNETKGILNCEIVMIQGDKVINSLRISLLSTPRVDDKLIINMTSGSALFKVMEVVKDITIKKNKVTTRDILYVESIDGGG